MTSLRLQCISILISFNLLMSGLCEIVHAIVLNQASAAERPVGLMWLPVAALSTFGAAAGQLF